MRSLCRPGPLLKGSRTNSHHPTVPFLPSLDLPGVASYLQSPHCTNVSFLTGAGVSVAAGIPDFRSPGGMYETLRPELLTATPEQRRHMEAEPTAVVSWPLFRVNAFPYLELRRPFILGLGQWKATLAHYFMQIVHQKGLLGTVFTQNIDGLDYQTDVPVEKIIGVHGTMGLCGCEFCGGEVPMEEFREAVRKNIKDIYGVDESKSAPSESSPVLCPHCQRAGLKPQTVLYGGQLPDTFFGALPSLRSDTKLLIVMGTSLTVSPANCVPAEVAEDCVRLIVNDEMVGRDVGIRYGSDSTRDVFDGDACDATVLKLAALLGWVEDLVALKDRMAPESQARLETFLRTEGGKDP